MNKIFGLSKLNCVILLFFIISIGANIYLIKLSLNYYKQVNIVRIDPLGNNFKNWTKNSIDSDKTKSIVIFGDSRAEKWHPVFKINGFRILNRGIGGQTTQQLRLRIRKDVISISPSLVIIQAGINDLKTIELFPKLKDQIVDNCINNLSLMYRELVDQNISVIALTIFPIRRPGIIRSLIWSENINEAIKEVNSFIISTMNNRIHVIDADLILKDSLFLNQKYGEDMLHLNSNGYDKINKYLESYLESLK